MRQCKKLVIKSIVVCAIVRHIADTPCETALLNQIIRRLAIDEILRKQCSRILRSGHLIKGRSNRGLNREHTDRTGTQHNEHEAHNGSIALSIHGTFLYFR